MRSDHETITIWDHQNTLTCTIELQTKVRKHGEGPYKGPYKGLLLVESVDPTESRCEIGTLTQ